ncbi:MAG: hypothetical protein RL251_1213 [Pseudomonadota bacterium]|jgi:pimeloyl-ACP methyl ester carboxylesterase
MSGFDDIAVATADRRLKLYARSYPGPEPTILMLHGLTRNACDFDGLAARLRGRYRLVVADQRGRGKSDWDPNPANYAPATYCADMLHLIDELKLDRPIIIGTSMGGLMAMIMATLRPNGFRGIILNDVGPQIEQAGLDRIASYVGASDVIESWEDAAAYCRRINGYAFPDYDDAQWDAFARCVFHENDVGVPVLAHDPAIAAGLSSTNPTAVPPDMWSMWQGLADMPVLAVRGALSDILSTQTLHRMAELHPRMQSVTVSNVGHAPMLDEPEALAAINSFLAAL